MKRVDPRQYVQKLQDFITEIDDINEKASEYYLKLIDFIKEDKVNEVDELEYKQTVAEFQDASDKYLELKDKLSNLDIPVAQMGMHQILVKYYDAYADATKLMSDSLGETRSEFNKTDFNQSDENQAQTIQKFQTTFTKIIYSVKIQ